MKEQKIKRVNTRRINITILEKDYNEIHRIVEENKYLSFSEFIREAIRTQLNKNAKNEELKNINTNLQDMREFVNQMFKVIEDTGINDLNDIKGNYAEILIKFTNSIEELDDKQKNLMKTLFKSLFETVIETVRSQSNISAISELDKRNRKNI